VERLTFCGTLKKPLDVFFFYKVLDIIPIYDWKRELLVKEHSANLVLDFFMIPVSFLPHVVEWDRQETAQRHKHEHYHVHLHPSL
jgi:hypothetical protein